MFKSIAKSDITIRPFKAYKSWNFDENSLPFHVVRNLSGSWENSEGIEVNGFNEYSLYRSLKQLYYSNGLTLIGYVSNWNFVKHKAKKQTTYDVVTTYNLSTSTTQTYSYYFDDATQKYVDEFSHYLTANGYIVNDNGQILKGSWADVTKMYGVMNNYTSVQERSISDRLMFLNIPQRYIGEGIKPQSFVLTDYSTLTGNGSYSKITDDGKNNLVYQGRDFLQTYAFDIENETLSILTNDGFNYILGVDSLDFGDEESNVSPSIILTYNGSSPFSTTLDSIDLLSGVLFSLDNFNLPTGVTNSPKVVGNIFYANGIVTLTWQTDLYSDTQTEQINYNFDSKNYSVEFKSTKTIYENEVFLEVSPNEFNYSTNPSATKFYNGDVYVKKYIPFKPASLDYTGSAYDLDFRIVSDYDGLTKIGFDEYDYSSSLEPTGSYLAPYVTTIGLYDENYEMVAVAKIPSKPKSLPDYPLNFVIRFDT